MTENYELIKHHSLGDLFFYGTALHTEENIDYSIYYTKGKQFVAVPSGLDITTIAVSNEDLESVDYTENTERRVTHYKGGSYDVGGNVLNITNGEVLVEYTNVASHDLNYLRPHGMFYETVTVPRFKLEDKWNA